MRVARKSRRSTEKASSDRQPQFSAKVSPIERELRNRGVAPALLAASTEETTGSKIAWANLSDLRGKNVLPN
jgi:hypothetical protein